MLANKVMGKQKVSLSKEKMLSRDNSVQQIQAIHVKGGAIFDDPETEISSISHAGGPDHATM